jgi:putative addiction module killer protein
VVAIREYEDANGRRPFGRWFDGLNIEAAVKVETALARLEVGNFSNVKGVGEGVFEIRVHFGPGYRVYFGKESDTIVILLAGGDKKSQGRNIRAAKRHWRDYKKRRTEEGG